MHMRTLMSVLVSTGLLTAAACAPDTSGSAADAAGQATVQAEAPHYFDDPDLQRIYAHMMETMAPNDGWHRTRYIQFDWMLDRGDAGVLRRSHRWDVWGGAYRLQAPLGKDHEMVALFNVNHPGDGRVWVDGALQEAPRADSLLRRANAIFINDSYWLLMPYKWADPGVHASYLGTNEMNGAPYEVVELTFEGVGITPQNKYRGWVNPDSWLMDYWQHYRNADDPEPAFTLGWTDWKRYGPIMLSDKRPDENGNSRIYFENLRAEEFVPEGMFEPPEM